MSGKGSSPRPFSVDRKTFEDNWDRVFGQKEPAEETKPKPTLICPHCGRDRYREDCIYDTNFALRHEKCPMNATALDRKGMK